MATYRVHSGETLGSAARRIFLARVDDAREELDEVTPKTIGSAVHLVRKRCKQGRGLIRLVRPALGDDYQLANRLLRDAARALEPIRDPHSMLECFDNLIAADTRLVPRPGLTTVRTELVHRRDAADQAALAVDSTAIGTCRRLLDEAIDASDEWDITDDFDVAAEGVKKTYKRGRNALATARDEPRVDAFHEWRKRVKYLRYQVRLLQNMAPAVLKPLRCHLHDLSDALGDTHDLALLVTEIRGWRDNVANEEERATLTAMADGRRSDLERRAVSLGDRLYAEKPKHFIRRFGAYWDAWIDGEELEAGAITDLWPPTDGLNDTTYDELYALARRHDVPGRSTMDRTELVHAVRAAGVASDR